MTICWNSLRGRRLRATRVNACGVPVAGTCAQAITDGFVSIEFSPEFAEGEEIEVRKADGILYVSDLGCPELLPAAVGGDGVLGDFTIENDATTFTLSARTKPGSGGCLYVLGQAGLSSGMR
ncbi:hypothetical protein [Actinomadura rudentiformis]|uniref:Uncharacterized protein n=1 Tax=Actinomadura rudentiformis TaxID=359158 RepID=A0A6H9YJA9_9ACTN|nr:hypothetical protein [Actinomadura rudentiformis]KAB2346923.1 hypothetical protein F8566_22280 [Actinomadura rudentiformis]